MSCISVLLIAMKKDTDNWLNVQAHLNSPFNNITIHNSKYVRVSSIKVTIPLYYSEDSCLFSTNNTQLIHMMIDRCEIERNLPYMEWEQTVRSILLNRQELKTPILINLLIGILEAYHFHWLVTESVQKKRLAHLDSIVPIKEAKFYLVMTK